MSRLGLAEAQAQTGQYEQAINTFKDLAQRKDGEVPVDGVLLRLGRVYVDAGRRRAMRNRPSTDWSKNSGFTVFGRCAARVDQLKKT
jgi:hypothetical protein